MTSHCQHPSERANGMTTLLLWQMHSPVGSRSHTDPAEDLECPWIICHVQKKIQVTSGSCRLSKPAAVLHGKSPVLVFTQSEPCGRAPQGSLFWPSVILGSSHNFTWVPVPLSPEIQITPLNCVSLPNPSFLPHRLTWPWQVQKCLEAEAELPFVHAYTMESVAWRPWKCSGLPQTISLLFTCSEIIQYHLILWGPLLATHILLTWILSETRMSLGALATLCWSKLAASTQCLVREESKPFITQIRKTPKSLVIFKTDTH